VITHYRDLRVWQRGVELAEAVHRLTADFPRPVGTALMSQMQRAAIAVPAHVAEGQTRGVKGDYAQHVAAAHSALAELVTYVEIARRLGYLSAAHADQLTEQAEALSRQVSALRSALQAALAQS
jgi:four helix bundle protein